ncbi:hypothetical protein JCM1840_005736 [Sporobolomyces johnsonii]
MTPRPVHLVTVLHGLWGSPSHVEYICQSVLTHAARPDAPRSQPRSSSPTRASDADRDNDVEVVVLPAKLNEFTNTYDGIDLCAERVLTEIDDECKRIEDDGGRVERFSIVGYSLGGLVARYVLGLLDSRTPSFFEAVRPVNFTTFASPAIGIPKYETFWSGVLRFLGARLLSRSGSQLYERDRFLPSRFNPDSPLYSSPPSSSKLAKFLPLGRRDKAEPLLKVMADPRYSFYQALQRFERIEVFANTVNDRTVPFCTGAFEYHDPFALARAKAKKVAEERGDDPDDELDIREGGLEITLDPKAPIISSYRLIDPSTSTTKPTAAAPTRPRRFRVRLPLLLRPTTYPFSRPVSLAIIFLLPVALPLSLIYIIGRFLLQGRSSKRRIREMRRLAGGGREGMLERVGVRLREVAELAGTDNPEYAAGLDGGEGAASENGGAVDGEGDGLKRGRDSVSRTTTTTYGTTASTPVGSGQSTPALARGGSPPSRLYSTALGSSSSSSSSSLSSPHTPHPEAVKYSTDPIFTPSQIFQIEHLNALPQLRKHFAYLPQSRNSHGAIIRRDARFEQHRVGKKVVDFWAREFRV